MISTNLANQVLFNSLKLDVNQLYIVSGYATPNMASWFMKNLSSVTNKTVEIKLIVGMVPYDGLSVAIHEGFKELMTDSLPKEIKSFKCSYVFENPPVHSKVYIWANDDVPVSAFLGSANFTQSAFSSSKREVMVECDVDEAMKYYNFIENNTIYCNHSEVEEYIVLYPTHPILDKENHPVENLVGAGIDSVTLSLLARDGETGKKSGVNWGQRNRRNKNEAYISLPAHIMRTGFFPLGEQHFTAVTDDGH